MEHETSEREKSQPLFNVILRVELTHTNMLKGHERRLLSLKSARFLQACMSYVVYQCNRPRISWTHNKFFKDKVENVGRSSTS